MKILMVCLGNICRSPLAEGILKHKMKKAGVDWKVDSAGTNAYDPGGPPHHFSQKVAMEFGIDIGNQVCRQLHHDDIINFDKLYVMDDQNYDYVKRISGKNWLPAKVDYIMNELYGGENRTVPDPWNGGENGFRKVFNLLDEVCDEILEKYAPADI